jgi:hypothetical protein
MKNIVIGGIIVFAVTLFAPQIVPAQGTMTYVSNVDQPSSGSLAVGSNSWLAVDFLTGNNSSGYIFDSIQLAMTNASGNPSGFTVMLYSLAQHGGVGTNLDTLNGSLNPTDAGIYTFTSASNLMLSAHTAYFIVLTSGTAVANGAFNWSEAASYNSEGGWIGAYSIVSFSAEVGQSSDGLNWDSAFTGYPQYAINATPIPEPGVLGLFSLGGLGTLLLGFRCRKNSLQKNRD